MFDDLMSSKFHARLSVDTERVNYEVVIVYVYAGRANMLRWLSTHVDMCDSDHAVHLYLAQAWPFSVLVCCSTQV